MIRRDTMFAFVLFLLASFALAPACVTTLDDDDDAGDDDSGNETPTATPTPSPTPTAPFADCTGIAAGPIDLTNPVEVGNLFYLNQILQQYLSINIYLDQADAVCPVLSGDDPQNDMMGSLNILGGCTANPSGYAYGGEVDLDWEYSQYTADYVYTGQEFSSVGNSDWYADMFFDGSIEISQAQLVTRGTQYPEQWSSSLDGEFRILSGVSNQFPDTIVPMGVRGTYAGTYFEDVQAGESSQVVSGDLFAICRGPFASAMDFTWDGSRCPGEEEPDSGTATFVAEGVTTVIDLAGDNSCDGCLGWSVDGVEQNSPICF